MATIRSEKENEAAALAELEKMEKAELDPTHPDNFNIVPNKPLPEGFVNPPCGDPGHFCLDRAKCYQPDWVQIIIKRTHAKQPDPVIFPLSSTWMIGLEKWCDAPPEIKESLVSAVQTVYPSNVKPGNIDLTKDSEPLEQGYNIDRFVWQWLPSAQVPK